MIHAPTTKEPRLILNADIHIRTDKRIKEGLRKHAENIGISLSDYVRLVLDQAARTPFRLKKGRLP